MFREAHRRRIFRVAGLYVIGAWLALQVADVVFPGLGIPEGAIRALLIAVALGFPVALVFGWMFDIGPGGIRRTRPAAGETAPVTLKAPDYAILAVFLLVGGVIVYNATRGVLEAPRETTPEVASAQREPEEIPKLENSIAVLPFASLSPDPENEFFADGIAEEILNRLGAFRELNIIGRTSSFAFKGRNVGVPQIATALGVEYLLQGSVRRSGDQLRITAQLLDEGGLQLWTERFDRELTDVFAIQEEIADRVALTVVPHISMATPSGRPPVFQAYELYLKGRELLHIRQFRRARPVLQQAVELDPEFAEAHAERAIVRVMGFPLAEDLENAQAAIDRALSLKPGLVRAREAQGLLFNQSEEYARGEAILREVLSEEPNRTDALHWLAISLGMQGKEQESIQIRERAYRIDPLHSSVVVNLAADYRNVGNTERAKSILSRLIENVPDTRIGYFYLAGCYRTEGDLVEVDRILKRAALNQAASQYYQLTMNYAALGNWTLAQAWVERGKRDFPDGLWIPYLEGFLAEAQGRYQEAAQLMRRAWADESRQSNNLRVNVGNAIVLAGDYDQGISMLEPVLIAGEDRGVQTLVWPVQAQSLAWAYLQAGQRDEAARILELLDERFRELDRQGGLASTALTHPQDDPIYRDALNARLMGEIELALDRLERAADHGWADYYIRHHDPRWDVVRDDPRFQAIMARVKARADEMAAEVARMDAESDIFAELDAVMAEATPE